MSEDKIRCRLCNQEFERISSHLPRAHGIYISEYLQMFPDAPTISEGLRRRFSTSHEGLRDSEETKQGTQISSM